MPCLKTENSMREENLFKKKGKTGRDDTVIELDKQVSTVKPSKSKQKTKLSEKLMIVMADKM